MSIEEEHKLKELLKASIQPADSQLSRDLWPEMLHRLSERPAAAMPWYDWALLALLVLWFFLSPSGIPVFLYHL